MCSRSDHLNDTPFDFSERHSIFINAPSDVILNCVRHYRLGDDTLFRPALYLRSLPARLMRRPLPALDLDDFTLLLADHQRLVYGLKGAFWETDYGLLRFNTPTEFLGDRDASVATLILSFRISSVTESRTYLVTRTDILCPTRRIRRLFLPYWLLIRPVSGLLRRRMLSQIKARSEQSV
ncbi:hypothetical protein [Gluconobacter kanchanaburiensis]|nr:hypothetical protein [Gluconobacter kanchanaburiensis]MBF0860623.1 hypothetical protein [Gluconobacter kanchanaburiensis]